MIGRGVNVINRSNGGASGTYNSQSALVDYVIQSRKITFINSAGNEGDINKIGHPSTGLNVICVGSNSSNKAIAYSSSAGLSSEYNFLYKPTLVAPGDKLYDIPNVYSTISGTSFSTPMVTGIVALLMDEYPELKNQPEKVLSILTDSCTSVSGQCSFDDHDAGYGMVNYQNAREAYMNTYSFEIPKLQPANSLLWSKNIEVPLGKTVFASADVIYNPITSWKCSPSDLTHSKIGFEIKDSDGQYVCNGISKSNLGHIAFTNNNLQSNNFILEVYLSGSKNNNSREDCSLSYRIDNFFINNITISDNYLDRKPTFSWSINKEFIYQDLNVFNLKFVNMQNNTILTKTGINGKSYTLTKDEWSSIISATGYYYKVYVSYTLFSLPFSSTGFEVCSQLYTFREPDDFIDKIQIKPNEWGFESQYFFTTNQWKQTSTPITDHGITITHSRLRCAYIEDSYVVLSPKRQNAGYAYLTMTFSEPIYSYMFGVCLWSNNEGLNPNNCTAVVESMDAGGHWTEDLDLLNDITLSTRAQQIDRYEIATPTGIYGLRFVITSPATGTTNKGRICLDDIVLNNNLNDLWFISTFYE